MRIGILDDEEKERKQIQQYVCFYLDNKEISGEIFEFSSGEELIAYCRGGKDKKLDLLFLDVEMPGMDGIKVKNIVSDFDCIYRIVFVTSHSEAMPNAFGFKVIDFLVKPVDRCRIERQLDKVLSELSHNKIINIEGNDYAYLEDLEYIKSEGNYTWFYLNREDSPKIAAKQIGVVENELRDLPIVRVHRSYMVNLMAVLEISSDKVILQKEKIQIPLGRKYGKDVKASFVEYKKKQMRKRML